MLTLSNPAFLGAVNVVYDPDAAAYIAAVEAADGQPLETSVKLAYNAFFDGIRADGDLAKLKAACILGGARSLAGALVPLVPTMPSPTNFGFVAGDRSRALGMVGNGASKYLDTNLLSSAMPQGNYHMVTWVSQYASGDQYLMGETNAGTPGASFLLARNDAAFFRSRFTASGSESVAATGSQFSGGLFGFSRTASNNVNYSFRQNAGQVEGSLPLNSAAPDVNEKIFVYNTANLAYSLSRLLFFSAGESVNLTSLRGRLSTLAIALATL